MDYVYEANPAQLSCGGQQYPPLIINVQQPPTGIQACSSGCACSHSAVQKKVSMTPDLPIALPSLTMIVSAAMGGILLVCGYISCTDGTFECDDKKFPDISHVMGLAPLNKLYAIMLTAYAMNKQACVRSYHHALQGIASPCTQQAMLIYGLMGCIFGPLIGFFDVYYDMHTHCFVVALFVVGEVLYIFTATAVINGARDKFPQSSQSSIDTLVTCRLLTVVLGAVTLGAKVMGKDINPYSAYIEWILFIMSFFIFGVLASIMPYNAVVVPEEEKKTQ